MLKLPLFRELGELCAGELWSIVGDQNIRDTMAAELYPQELDDGSRSCRIEGTDFNKVGVVID